MDPTVMVNNIRDLLVQGLGAVLVLLAILVISKSRGKNVGDAAGGAAIAVIAICIASMGAVAAIWGPGILTWLST